jgi:hypothetical protein
MFRRTKMKKLKIASIILAATALIGVALFQIVPALADAPGPLDHVILSPTSQTLAPGATQQFVAQGVDAANAPITGLNYFWMVIAGGGTINTTGIFTAGDTTGTFTNTVEVVVVQGTIIKVANATIIVTPTVAGPLNHITITPAPAEFDVQKLIKMFTGYFRGTAFDNLLGGQWQIKNGAATDNVKAVPGVLQAVTATSLTVLQNGQTTPTTFTIDVNTNILPRVRLSRSMTKCGGHSQRSGQAGSKDCRDGHPASRTGKTP